MYSGNKSLHFHFCFDLRHLKRDLAVSGNSSYRDNWTRDLPDNLLRPAYAVSWDRLAETFCEIADLRPDPRLRSWEQLRRCPWAFRLVKRAHPLGLPSGYLIPPPVLASNIFRNIKREATGWFHDPEKLGELCRKEQVRRRKTFIQPEFDVTSGEQELFARRAPAIFEEIIVTRRRRVTRLRRVRNIRNSPVSRSTRRGSGVTSIMALVTRIRRRFATVTGAGFCC